MFHRLIAVSAAIALVSVSGVSLAQTFGSGSRGMGGMGSGSAFNGMGGGMMGGMSGGFGGMTGGMGMGGMGGGFGNSGFGGGGFGNSGFGGSGFGNSGFGNSGFGNNRGGYGNQQNFVGRDANDIQSTFGQMNKAGAQFFNTMNRNMKSASSSRRSNKKSTEQASSQPARVEVKVAFNPPRQPAEQVAKDIRTRLTKVLVANHMSQPSVTMEGDTAVVSGTAASENERDVISQLLAMEPSIHDVRNEMTITQPAATPSGTATPGS